MEINKSASTNAWIVRMNPYIVFPLSTGAFHREGSGDLYIHHRRREDVCSQNTVKPVSDY